MSKDNLILQAKGLEKSYKMGATRVEVLKGVNLDVQKGEFVAIIGASGSGKSTLLHILGALDRPDKGTVCFEGRDLNRMFAGTKIRTWISWTLMFGLLSKILRTGAKELHGDINEFRNKMVGFVFQFYHLLDELNVLENTTLPAMASRSIFGWFGARKWANSRAEELLNQFALGERIKHKPYQLSGGERQRVAIARALMNEPRLLLADEPTGNLDSATGSGILDVLEKLNEAGQTIVMVTHDDRIARRAGRVITLADGRING
ncbi:MAG: ABC transporter ATP-binding protein [Sedimentisphaerales bacterium]|nr:ABC transporter ATP-binding protein [Sedimentisphaerales bacterium]